jgi:hypothetical protein
MVCCDVNPFELQYLLIIVIYAFTYLRPDLAYLQLFVHSLVGVLTKVATDLTELANT